MNQLLVNKRETGKTTYLLLEVDRLLQEGCNIIILDSATEHENKSLLKKVMSKYEEAILLDVKDPSFITIQNGVENFVTNIKNEYPFSEIKQFKDKIICFDLSYFLEKGHEYLEEQNNKKLYKYYRNLYNNYAEQVITTLIILDYYNMITNTVVLMDEIELPIVDYDISIFQRNLKFIAAIHPENDFGSFYKSFKRAPFKQYKRKEEKL